MKWLYLIFIILVASETANADILALTDDDIQGKVLEVVHHKKRTYAKVKVPTENIWVEMPRQKLTVGKSYSFYLPYGEQIDFKEDGLKKVFRKLWLTIGVVDNTIDHNQYSFKNIKLGSKKDEVLDELTRMGLKVETDINDKPGVKVSWIKVNDFMLGNTPCVVSFSIDTNNKLASYAFEITKDIDAVSPVWAIDYLEFMSGVFKTKYGNPDRCSESTYIDVHTSQIMGCSWKRGDYDLHTSYQYRDSKGTVMGVVSSISRTLQNLNKIDEKIKRLKTKYNQVVEEGKAEAFNDGASSY